MGDLASEKVQVDRKPLSGKQVFLGFMGIIAALTALAIAPAVVIAAWNWLI